MSKQQPKPGETQIKMNSNSDLETTNISEEKETTTNEAVAVEAAIETVVSIKATSKDQIDDEDDDVSDDNNTEKIIPKKDDSSLKNKLDSNAELPAITIAIAPIQPSTSLDEMPTTTILQDTTSDQQEKQQTPPEDCILDTKEITTDSTINVLQSSASELDIKVKPPPKNSPTIMRRLRKSTRSTRFRAKMNANGSIAASAAGAAGNNSGASTSNATTMGFNQSSKSATAHHYHINSKSSNKGGRSRRSIFKRPSVKTPLMQASTRFVTSIFYKGSYMQIGDIVSLVDNEQNVYYAQVRGLLVDTYCEKSAFLTWLIPTQDSPDPKDGFDPATYLIGPDEEFSRKLSYLEFIMHAPSNYYHDRTTPFPLPDSMDVQKQPGGYIWTHLPTYKRKKQFEHNSD